MKYNRASVRKAVQNYIEDNPLSQEHLDEHLLYKWAAIMARKLTDSAIEQWVERIALIPVQNFHFMAPDDFKRVIEAGYIMEVADPTRRWEITQAIIENVADNCDLEVNLKCPDCHGIPQYADCSQCEYNYIEVDVDDVWRAAHPEYYYGHMKEYVKTSSPLKEINKSTFHNQFRLMTPATGAFFNAQYHIPYCRNLNLDSSVKYRIEVDVNAGTKFVVNFEKGLVLLSYFGDHLDENGDPTIADIEEVYETISFYLDERQDWIKWKNEQKEVYLKSYQISKSERLRSMKLAKNKLKRIDIQEFFAQMHKHYLHRLGRPVYKTLLK